MTWEGDDGEYFEAGPILGRNTGNARAFVGPVKSPIWIGTREEKRRLLQSVDYVRMYEIWKNVHLWGQWPGGGGYEDQDFEVVDIVNTVETIYRNRFAPEGKIAEYTGKAAVYTEVLAQGKRIQ
jgi:hypothetical protein